MKFLILGILRIILIPVGIIAWFLTFLSIIGGMENHEDNIFSLFYDWWKSGFEG